MIILVLFDHAECCMTTQMKKAFLSHPNITRDPVLCSLWAYCFLNYDWCGEGVANGHPSHGSKPGLGCFRGGGPSQSINVGNSFPSGCTLQTNLCLVYHALSINKVWRYYTRFLSCSSLSEWDCKIALTDRKFYLSVEAWLTPLLGMMHSFKRCDWLIKKRNTNALLVIMGTEWTVKSIVDSCFIYSFMLVTLVLIHIILTEARGRAMCLWSL